MMVYCLLIELIYNKFLPLFVNYVNNEKSNFVKNKSYKLLHILFILLPCECVVSNVIDIYY